MSTPKVLFDECEDFFILVVECYVLTAAMTKIEMKSLHDTPSEDIVAANVWTLEKEE